MISPQLDTEYYMYMYISDYDTAQITVQWTLQDGIEYMLSISSLILLTVPPVSTYSFPTISNTLPTLKWCTHTLSLVEANSLQSASLVSNISSRYIHGHVHVHVIL